MRHPLLVFLLLACAGPREVVVPRIAVPPSEPRSQPAVEVTTAACPLDSARGTPGCGFTPVEASGPGLVAASRFNCTFATSPHFSRASAEPALLLTASVVEGATSYGVRLLRTAAGELRLLPGTLTEPGLVDGALVGLAPHDDELAFWKDGVCESPAGGRLVELAAGKNGEVFALQQTLERDVRVLRRARDGRWSSVGPVPWATEASLVASGGHVAVLTTDTQPPDWSAVLPDVNRSLVLRRADVPSRERPRATAVLPPATSTRFSAVAVVNADAKGAWSLRWPSAPRLELPIPPATGGCAAPRYGERPKDRDYVHAHAPAVAALRDAQLLVSWFEELGRCKYTFVEKEPVRCERGQPCRDTEPGHWELSQEPQGGVVVLARVGTSVEVLSRVELGPATGHAVFSTAIAVTPARVLVHAGAYLLEYDRAALENR